MGQFLPIFALMVLAGLFAGISFFASRLLNPPRPNAVKVAPYESGIMDITEPPERFPVRFMLVAMIFIVFDIETIFFFPFATVVGELGAFGLITVVIFSVTLLESLLFMISRGALDWGPLEEVRRSKLMTDRTRTARTTVRAVGTEGRQSVPVGDTEGRQSVPAGGTEGRQSVPAGGTEGRQSVPVGDTEGRANVPAGATEGRG